MASSIIHVEPNAAGRWIVRHDDEPQPLSEHESATAAERVARALAERDHASFVFLHDRYARIHRLPIKARTEQRGDHGEAARSIEKTTAEGDVTLMRCYRRWRQGSESPAGRERHS
jgi:hypothetical protein